MWKQALLIAVVGSFVCYSVAAIIVEPIAQSWLFLWESDPPTHVTAQCGSIQVTSARSSATGPNPVGPYFAHIYSSNYTSPFVVTSPDGNFNLTIPFPPNTTYQICMFDVNGNTGGCQAVYTVVEPANNVTCSMSSLPSPLNQLDMDTATDGTGPLSRWGWIPQCTDIMFTPKGGTPPYYMTAAPALRPPYNLTSSESSFNWTITLQWGMPFFITVADSAGNGWVYGPQHSGESDIFSCLVPESSRSAGISSGAAVGVGIGSLVAGILAGVAAMLAWYRHKRSQLVAKQAMLSTTSIPQTPASPLSGPPMTVDQSPHLTSGLVSTIIERGAPERQIDPFPMPTTDRPNTGTSREAWSPSSTGASAGHVYVVHHDGGRAPVTVFHDSGTAVVELPPHYNNPGSRRQSTLPENDTQTTTDSTRDSARSPLSPQRHAQ